MHAPLRTLQAMAADDGNRRRDWRHPGGIGAHLLMAGRDACAATLTDVSRHGCCAQSTADWLRPGRFVAVALPDTAPLECIVRWIRGDLAGLELLRPIPADRPDWLALVD